MKTLHLVFLLLTATCCLVGCKKSYTHEYLLQHPNVVQTELAQCRKAAEYTSYCDMVKHTADEFDALVNVRSQNQEAFGKQLLQAEKNLVVAKESMLQAQQSYEQSKLANQSIPNDVQQKFLQAKQNYQIQAQKVATLLAVVAAMSMVGL